MPTPPECQPIADVLANLGAQEQTQLSLIQSLSGIDKWKAIEALGTIRQNISEQQLLLTQCIKDHAADFSTQVVVYDVSATSGPNRIARLWQLTSAGQAVKQTTTVQAGTATLSGVSGNDRQSFGITIEEVDHPTVCGPDFRSVLLPGVDDPQRFDPTTQIEIVILDPITLSTDSLHQTAPPLPIQLSCAAGPLGTVNVLVNSLNLVVDSGGIVLTAVGTATSGFTHSTFTFVNAFHIVPTFKMGPSSLVEILSGVPPVLSMSGLVGNFVQDIAPLLSARLTDQAITPLAALLNRIISNEVTAKLGLASLPSGSVLSVREVSANASGITVVPVLGAFGTVLTDFQPSPQRVLPRLADLGLQPSLIATGDPTTNVAKGKLTLDGPAPAGGVTVQLSCDRSDLLRLDPASLMIPKGALTGEFTATGIAPSIASSTPADVTVSASLEEQTITAHVSVRLENPATTIPNSGSIFTLPAAKMAAALNAAAAEPRPIGIQDLQVDTSVITRGTTVHGQVVLDGILTATEMIHLTFDPSVIASPYFTIPAQTIAPPTGFFSFVVDASFPADSLKITARVHSSGLRRSIFVPVAK